VQARSTIAPTVRGGGSGMWSLVRVRRGVSFFSARSRCSGSVVRCSGSA
jgi:hypothetical protein